MEPNKPNQNKIRNIISPSYEARNAALDYFKNIAYYVMIGLVSLLLLFVIPLFSGALYGDFTAYFPETMEGWIVWLVLRISSAVGNMALFILFKLQAKKNILGNANYQEACDILDTLAARAAKVRRPRSPWRMNFDDYIVKGASLVVMTLVSTITITALVISFDIISFISMIVTVVLGILFGWTTMINNEEY